MTKVFWRVPPPAEQGGSTEQGVATLRKWRLIWGQLCIFSTNGKGWLGKEADPRSVNALPRGNSPLRQSSSQHSAKVNRCTGFTYWHVDIWLTHDCFLVEIQFPIFGPLLFSLYMFYDLPSSVCHEVEIQMFADRWSTSMERELSKWQLRMFHNGSTNPGSP